ncbi:hypothetical protein L6452_02346 [Arctium lappa]|uniref:Uncharacterized protein n=1 Tax=Arctium lappa TaxID=4217 RepID=A0ACB9FJC8_ARCLA|nr:hypothetical protein L6452_02346 [Arctium lappa]
MGSAAAVKQQTAAAAYQQTAAAAYQQPAAASTSTASLLSVVNRLVEAAAFVSSLLLASGVSLLLVCCLC